MGYNFNLDLNETPPRSPPVIKPLLKVGAEVTFLGRVCKVLSITGTNAMLAYADSVGVIHTLVVDQAVL